MADIRTLTAVRTAALTGLPNGAHESAMTWHTGWTAPRAWAVTNAAIDRADVIAELPMECARLRRLREIRRSARRAHVHT